MSQNIKEQKHLEYIIKKLHHKLEDVNHDINCQDINYKELQSYMVEQKSQLDKFELFFQEQQLSLIDKRGHSQVLQREQLLSLIDSPYFGKFNFVYVGETEEDAEAFYIGRFGFSDDDGQILIYDWRAPVSNMYYEFELGAAFYEALGKRYDGELIKKQQFKIQQSKLNYILDSSLAIQDTVLQDTLSEHSTHNMKTIVDTIQREQNAIVRHELAHTIVIQGVAGSGKTSVALHRIAYLIYKYRETLAAQHIFILSPNKVFADYISTVLPELGEEPIPSFTLDELTSFILSGSYSYHSFEQEIREIMNNPRGALAKRAKFKANYSFVQSLQSFLEELNLSILKTKDVQFVGYTFEVQFLQSRFLAYKNEPILVRLSLIADDIIHALQSKRNGELKSPRKKEIVQTLHKLLEFTSALDIYITFMKQFDDHLLQFNKGILEFNDVYPYLFCQIYFKGIDSYEHIQYFVLDEMQDYTPIQYAVLSKIFACKKTIIGDFGQALFPFETITKDAFEHLFHDMSYMELTASYRSSYEIAHFANRFKPHSTIQPIERHGEAPVEHHYSNEEEMLHLLDKYMLNDYKTTAIICKTDEDINTIRQFMQHRPYSLLNGETKQFTPGIILTTIQYAKGLEFDCVIVPFVNATNYSHSYDQGLLYIAATRAMHHLIFLIDSNNSSPLI